MILILDIDGTINNLQHREHFITQPQPDWDAFLDPRNVALDSPLPEAQEALPALLMHSSSLIFVTGRRASLEIVTVAWLREHYRLLPDEDYKLFMRPVDSVITASAYKKEALKRVFNEVVFHYDTRPDLVFIDDDPYVLAEYSAHGLTLKAPECWKLLLHKKPLEQEALWSK